MVKINMNKKVILVTEDERSIREALVDKLSKEGFVVFEAKDGIEGWDISTKEHPDLIFLDLAMPKMDGLSMMKKLLENESTKDIDFIVLTNSDGNEKLAEAMNLVERYGVKTLDYYIKSNIKLEDLVEKIKTKLHL